MAIREGKWKCPSCSTVNRGANVQCDQCGTTRDANVKFFLDEDAPEVTDPEQLKRAQAGADWICEYCGNSSPAASPICTGCGAPKSAKEKKHGDVIPVGGPPPAKPNADQVVMAPKPKSALGPVAFGVILLMMLMCCVCGWWQFRTQSDTATVATASWQRTIDIEDFIPVQESQWGSAPEGAYAVRHQREQHGTREVKHGTKTETYTESVQVGTKRVKTGNRDLGNGHFEDVYKDEPIYEEKQRTREVDNMVTEPVYEEHYYYTIKRWKVTRSPTTKGGATDPPAWPEIQLKGDEKKSTQTETYLVTIRGEKMGEKRMAAPSQAEWEKFKPGSTWKVEYNNVGDVTVLDANGQPTKLVPVKDQKP